jgi:hypothetical protein
MPKEADFNEGFKWLPKKSIIARKTPTPKQDAAVAMMDNVVKHV